jgi:phospholipid/cholesterol/gamma-HCH transport system substrate-binding protein
VNPASRRYNEIYVGVFVLAGLVAIITVLFMLTNPAMFRGRYLAKVVVDNASGLRRGDPVLMRGVDIGRVRGFDIVPEGVVINVELDKQYRVPVDSRVVLRSSSILGEMSAEIHPGVSSVPLQAGGTLRGTRAPSPIRRASNVVEEAAGALDRVQELLSDTTIGNVKASAAELQQLLSQLSALAGELHAVGDDLQKTSSAVRRIATGPELIGTVQDLDALVSRLNNVADSLGDSAEGARLFITRLNRGEGSLGKLSRDEALYVNANKAMIGLSRAAAAVTSLAEDIKRQPKRYLNLSIF